MKYGLCSLAWQSPFGGNDPAKFYDGVVRHFEKAKKYELLLVPSDSFGVPGYVRIAYCVSNEQIQRSIPAFKALYEEYQK